MASYLTTVDIGQFDMKTYRDHGIRYTDALDPDLFCLPHIGNARYEPSSKKQRCAPARTEPSVPARNVWSPLLQYRFGSERC